MNIIIDDRYLTGFTAGSKARNDIDSIMSDWKIKSIQQFLNNIFLTRLSIILNLSLMPRHTKMADSVLVQYPIYLCRPFHKLKRVKISGSAYKIALIHDLNSLRFTPTDYHKIKYEIESLNYYDAVISHNQKMTQWLKDNGLTCKVVNLELFDYCAEDSLPIERKFERSNIQIVYAGNLSKDKSGFLANIPIDSAITYNLYGVGFEGIANSSLCYVDKYSPEQLPNKLAGQFGLVWDGSSVDKCDGLAGDYLKYNNPHKLSLYVAAGLPVITWKQAAIADFVVKNQIGFTIDSLNDIKEEISNLTDQDYNKYLSNITVLQKKVRHGYFTHEALKSIATQME